MRARFCVLIVTTAVLTVRTAAAGPWNTDPKLGVSAQYATNSLLSEFDPLAEEHVAALIDLPLHYDADALEFTIRPYGRLSNSQGYSALGSNYVHLDSYAQFSNELGSTTVQTFLARDSSLYYVGALVNGVGVPRNSESSVVDWKRLVTERNQIELDASWTEVRYSQPPNLNALTNYRYYNAGPTWSYNESERNTLQLSGNVGLYQSLNGLSESRSENLQLAFLRPLTEIWSLSTSVGYSRSKNSEKLLNLYEFFIFGVTAYDTVSANQSGAVYAATLTRTGERFALIVGASRALQPTGLAYLSRQDTVSLTTTYTRNERWDYALSASWERALTPVQVQNGNAINAKELSVRYLNPQLSANWHWTAQWVVSAHVSRITQQFGPPTVTSAGTIVGLDISRQFLRTEF